VTRTERMGALAGARNRERRNTLTGRADAATPPVCVRTLVRGVHSTGRLSAGAWSYPFARMASCPPGSKDALQQGRGRAQQSTASVRVFPCDNVRLWQQALHRCTHSPPASSLASPLKCRVFWVVWRRGQTFLKARPASAPIWLSRPIVRRRTDASPLWMIAIAGMWVRPSPAAQRTTAAGVGAVAFRRRVGAALRSDDRRRPVGRAVPATRPDADSTPA
jgi:hypothetical protein